MGKLTAKQLQKQKLINSQEYTILVTLRKLTKPVSNRALVSLVSMPINVVTPRMNSLRRKLLVEPAGRVYDQETNRTVQVWTA